MLTFLMSVLYYYITNYHKKLMLKKVFQVALIVVFLGVGFMPSNSVEAATMAQNLSGRILLQVQDNGEAWYVNPVNLQRYYMGRPDDAFNLMRSLGLGITNADLAKIPFGDVFPTGVDSDIDGLTNDFENSQVTNVNYWDTDYDGFSDKDEILNGYSPLSKSTDKVPVDNALRAKLSGRILLQVQSHGEAWYVNPVNLKRYYLGRPADAFEIMRKLGLGITNEDLSKITIAQGVPDVTNRYLTLAVSATASNAATFKANELLNNVYQNTNCCSYELWAGTSTVNLSKYLFSGFTSYSYNDKEVTINVNNISTGYYYFQLVNNANGAKSNVVGVQINNVVDNNRQLTLSLSGSTSNSATFTSSEYYNSNLQTMSASNYELWAGTSSSNVYNSYLSNLGASKSLTADSSYVIRSYVYNLPTGYYYFQLVNKVNGVKSSVYGLQINNVVSDYRQLSLSLDDYGTNWASLTAKEYLNGSSQTMYTSNYELWAGTSSSNTTKYYLGNIGSTVNYSGNATKEITANAGNLTTGYYYFKLVNKNNGVQSNFVGAQINNSVSQVSELTLSLYDSDTDSATFKEREYLNGSSQTIYNTNYELWAGTSSSNLTKAYLGNIGASINLSGSGTTQITTTVANLSPGTYYFQLVKKNSTLKSGIVTVTITQTATTRLDLSLNDISGDTVTLDGMQYAGSSSQVMNNGDYELRGGSANHDLSSAYFSRIGATAVVHGGSTVYKVAAQVSNLTVGTHYFQLVNKNTGLTSNIISATVEETGVQTMDLTYMGQTRGMLIFEAVNYEDDAAQAPVSASHYVLLSTTGSSLSIDNDYDNLDYTVEFANNIVRFMVTDFTQTGTFKFRAAKFDGTPFTGAYVGSDTVTVTLN
jgi:hypothetical protein